MNKIYVRIPKKKFKMSKDGKAYLVELKKITFCLDEKMFEMGADDSLHICLNNNSVIPVEFMNRGTGNRKTDALLSLWYPLLS